LLNFCHADIVFPQMGDSCARVRVRVLAHHPKRCLEGDRPVALNFDPTHLFLPAAADDSDPVRRERMVTAVAVALAVLVVAAVAFLMGLA
jgi:hypothetical protein